MAVTGTLMVAEAVGGWWSGSLALLADAGHMLTDLLALVVAFAAVSIAARPADAKATYGYRRIEILAALFNGLTLVGLSLGIGWEAVERWNQPGPIQIEVMGTVAAIGLAANLLGLWLLHDHDHNLNTRGAFLHVLGDALTSVGVLVGAGIIALTGWTRIDAIISIGIAAVIVFTSLLLLRDVFNVLMEAAPPGLDTETIRKTIVAVPGVEGVHDLHVWSITTGMPALSAHVVAPQSNPSDLLPNIQAVLRERFQIDHATLQIEKDPEHPCGGCA